MAEIKRVTLTKKEAESPFGQRLVHQILALSHDGDITLDEVKALHANLRGGPSSCNAVGFLRALTTSILADGELDAMETYQIRRAMERVVPKSVRMQLTELLSGIGLPTTEVDDGDEDGEPTTWRASSSAWRSDPVTARQLAFIRDLGGHADERLTKGAASKLIDELLERRPPTPRQVMLLRFFDRMDLTKSTKEEVSVWIDACFAADERYERAWDLFKVENGDDRTMRDPGGVPIGAYRKYLPARPIAGEKPAGVRGRGLRAVHIVLAAFLLLVACGAVVLVLALR